MVRSLSFAAAVAAILVIPFTQADARHGGMGGARGGSVHMSSMRGFSGPRVGNFSINRSVAINRSVSINRLHVGPRRVAFVGPHFRHRRFFGGIYAVGLYDTCWRWVPTAFGWRRLWVCDPYPYY